MEARESVNEPNTCWELERSAVRGDKEGRGGARKGWGPEGVGGPNALFFHLPPQNFVLFFPLWGSSRGILVVFEVPGPSNVRAFGGFGGQAAKVHM